MKALVFVLVSTPYELQSQNYKKRGPLPVNYSDIDCCRDLQGYSAGHFKTTSSCVVRQIFRSFMQQVKQAFSHFASKAIKRAKIKAKNQKK